MKKKVWNWLEKLVMSVPWRRPSFLNTIEARIVANFILIRVGLGRFADFQLRKI